MVFLILREQLGNQLFQWASAFAISLKWKCPLNIITTNYGRTGTYMYLRLFPVSARFLSPWPGLLSRKLLRRELWELQKYDAIVGDWNPEWEPAIDNCLFRRLFAEEPKRTLLDGMFQSWMYFHECREDIRRELSLCGDVVRRYADGDWLRQINASESVSLHIRRTDYLVPGNREKFAVCSQEYYWRCVDECRRSLEKPVFFVFSDDIDWARSVFVGREFRFVSSTEFRKVNISDFVLMANCRHHIISNSSFSWWASYAGVDSHCVLMPDRWFNDDTAPIELKRPPGWTLVPVD